MSIADTIPWWDADVTAVDGDLLTKSGLYRVILANTPAYDQHLIIAMHTNAEQVRQAADEALERIRIALIG